MKLLKGVAFSLLLFLTCFFGTLVLLTPLIPLALTWTSLGRRMMDLFLWLWFVFAVAMYELLLGIKIVIHGHPGPTTDSTLILCNHRTRLDWLFLMAYQLRCGSLSHYRISLKASLKHIPGPGWAMQCAGFLFLQREWSKDKHWISRALRYFSGSGTHPQFLLFPEGTDFCENGLAKSRSFAEQNGYPIYDYVLHPRTTGFIHFVNEMKENKILDSVLDVTVAYPKDIIHGEADLAKGLAPQEVHFSVENHPVSDLPQSADKLEDWLRDLWRQKEAKLEKYYTDDAKVFSMNGEKPYVSEAKEASVRELLWMVVVFWALFLSVVFYALVVFPLFKWYCVLSAATFVFLGKYYGGVDALLYATCD
ncbi:hypothetical protein BaRGS_00021672 [Batillaria attramentaria]|uniref:Phospholipid/glycerol acyltransferase domain-containing protein n=1 Tax=Batillaria attramentaria TaxID=370345 RepID=A0ABD0KJA0_9CAEN